MDRDPSPRPPLPEPRRPLPLHRWLAVGLLFAGLHQVTTLQLWFYALASDPRAPWGSAAVVEASLWFPWLALLPLVAWNCRRNRLDGGFRPGPLARHAGIALGIIGLHLLLMPLVRAGLETLFLASDQATTMYGRVPFPGLAYLERLASFRGLAWTAGDLVWYAVLATGLYWLDSRERLRQKEVREAELRTQATKAQLEALRHRLEPHFFFNALNALSALIRTDPRQAESMLDALAELFRKVLVQPSLETIPLRQELAIVHSYLEVERFRFGDDLSFTLDAPAELDALPVPAMILQPLVENAIRHGLAPKGAPGRLEIQARILGEHLELSVKDDGPGYGTSGLGIGLSATRDRLKTLYGASARLDAGPLPGEGYRASVHLPLPGGMT